MTNTNVLTSILFLYFSYNNCLVESKIQNYSPGEKEAIIKLRNSVKDLITEERYKHQLEDSYLYLWLNSKKFNLDDTAQAFKQNLKWRENQKMSTIVSEPEMIKMNQVLKYSNDLLDKEGHPTLQLIYGNWNLRRLALAGKVNETARYSQFILENMALAARAANTTQYNILFSFYNFNLREQGCLVCLNFAANFVNIYEKYYPGQYNQIVVFNCPRTFEVLLNFLRPILSEDTKKKLKVFGQDKYEYQEHIKKTYSLDQLTPTFGGFKKQ